jgi:hypothetical protein
MPLFNATSGFQPRTAVARRTVEILVEIPITGFLNRYFAACRAGCYKSMYAVTY